MALKNPANRRRTQMLTPEEFHYGFTNTLKIQKKTGALTELKEYPDRSHYTFAQDGWEEVADYSLDWAVRNART